MKRAVLRAKSNRHALRLWRVCCLKAAGLPAETVGVATTAITLAAAGQPSDTRNDADGAATRIAAVVAPLSPPYYVVPDFSFLRFALQLQVDDLFPLFKESLDVKSIRVLLSEAVEGDIVNLAMLGTTAARPAPVPASSTAPASAATIHNKGATPLSPTTATAVSKKRRHHRLPSRWPAISPSSGPHGGGGVFRARGGGSAPSGRMDAAPGDIVPLLRGMTRCAMASAPTTTAAATPLTTTTMTADAAALVAPSSPAAERRINSDKATLALLRALLTEPSRVISACPARDEHTSGGESNGDATTPPKRKSAADVRRGFDEEVAATSHRLAAQGRGGSRGAGGYPHAIGFGDKRWKFSAATAAERGGGRGGTPSRGSGGRGRGGHNNNSNESDDEQQTVEALRPVVAGAPVMSTAPAVVFLATGSHDLRRWVLRDPLLCRRVAFLRLTASPTAVWLDEPTGLCARTAASTTAVAHSDPSLSSSVGPSRLLSKDAAFMKHLAKTGLMKKLPSRSPSATHPPVGFRQQQRMANQQQQLRQQQQAAATNTTASPSTSAANNTAPPTASQTPLGAKRPREEVVAVPTPVVVSTTAQKGVGRTAGGEVAGVSWSVAASSGVVTTAAASPLRRKIPRSQRVNPLARKAPTTKVRFVSAAA